MINPAQESNQNKHDEGKRKKNYHFCKATRKKVEKPRKENKKNGQTE